MKIDELLYNATDELNEKEMELLDQVMDMEVSSEERNTWKRQENLAMNKIKTELQAGKKKIEEEPTKKHRLFGKRKVVLLVATLILMIGMMSFAKEQDWDIRMADMLGLSGVMENLDGGYVKIGVGDVEDRITITATQGIGDKNSMWVQLDTDLAWQVGENGYYTFEVDDGHWYKGVNQLSGEHQLYSYNNNGYVSFIWYFTGYEEINRSRVEVYLSQLRAYDTLEDDDEGYIVSDASWEFEWENCYAPNTVHVRPYKTVTMQSEFSGRKMDCFITKIEISPISMWIEAWKSPFENSKVGDSMFLSVDSITLQDGTKIIMDNGFSSAGMSNFRTDCFLDFNDMQSVKVDEIDYVTICGKDIKIAR